MYSSLILTETTCILEKGSCTSKKSQHCLRHSKAEEKDWHVRKPAEIDFQIFLNPFIFILHRDRKENLILNHLFLLISQIIGSPSSLAMPCGVQGFLLVLCSRRKASCTAKGLKSSTWGGGVHTWFWVQGFLLVVLRELQCARHVSKPLSLFLQPPFILLQFRQDGFNSVKIYGIYLQSYCTPIFH